MNFHKRVHHTFGKAIRRDERIGEATFDNFNWAEKEREEGKKRQNLAAAMQFHDAIDFITNASSNEIGHQAIKTANEEVYLYVVGLWSEARWSCFSVWNSRSRPSHGKLENFSINLAQD